MTVLYVLICHWPQATAPGHPAPSRLASQLRGDQVLSVSSRDHLRDAGGLVAALDFDQGVPGELNAA